MQDEAKPKLAEAEQIAVLKSLFTEATILSLEVKKGAASSANIYVNKKFEGRKVMVIIW
jgi:putative transposon-encoded protein